MPNSMEESIQAGIDFLNANKTLTLEFSARAFQGVFPAFISPRNDAARAFDAVVDGGLHSGASYLNAFVLILKRAGEAGFTVESAPDKGLVTIKPANP
jgi:hypothetical protein